MRLRCTGSRILLGAIVLAASCGDVGLDDEDFLTPEEEADLYDPYVDAVEQTLDGKALSGGKKEKGYAPVGYLLFKNGGFCTATLIKKDVAITAAHCLVEKSADDVTFHLGKTIKKSKVKSKAEKLVPHPNHPTMSIGSVQPYDVGLVYLKKKIKKVKLAKIGQLAQQGQGCGYRYVGYGAGAGKFSSGRRSTDVCMQGRNGTFQMGITGDGYLCPGDSGGPVFREKTLEVVAVHNGAGNHAPADQKNQYCVHNSTQAHLYPLDLDMTFFSRLSD